MSGDEAPKTDHLERTLRDLREESNISGNRTFGTNVTYPMPMAVSAELAKLFQPEGRDPRAHYYQNVTGSFKGDWKYDEEIASRINQELPLPAAPQNDTTTEGDTGSKNGTTVDQDGDKKDASDDTVSDEQDTEEDEAPVDTIEDKKPLYLEDVDKFRGSFQYNKSGSFSFNLRETKATEYVNWVNGNWRIRHEDNEDYGISLSVQGVHFVHNGSFYMWGIPEDTRMSLWHILDLMPNNASFALAHAAIKTQYEKRIKTIENIIEGSETLEYLEGTLSEASNCHYQMYMQLGAIDPSVRSSAMKDLEREWAAPQGISTIKAPHLNSSLFLYSPNCRLTIGVKDAEGMKREKFYSKAVNYAGMAGTSVSKVSYWTIAIQVFMDSYLCMLHLTTSVLVDFLFIPFVAASFFSFVLVAIFGMRYMLVIWRIQRPERRGRRNQAAVAAAAAAAAAANTTNNNNGGNTEAGGATRPADAMPGGLPLPVTASRPTPADDSDNPRSDMQAIYGRFYWMLLASLIALYKILVSSTRVQNVMISISALCLFSFWIPQIVRNVTRGSKRGLNLWFVLGMSVTRLTLPIYFYGCPESLMGHKPTPWIWGLVLWVALQVGVLLLQDWLGPRFFVPKKYLPPVYDYHPIIPTGDGESGAGHTQHDCAICLLPIDTTSQAAGATRLSSVVGSLGRLNYMMTPCGHLFHTDCLEKWMRIKLECPHCRAYLPFV
ncbi:hypothetical protein BGZ79_008430 [Entomortierella chlamydospora]|nr:hypothetical protein BGZ79_008430 [Entomortierella chlamydospora]